MFKQNDKLEICFNCVFSPSIFPPTRKWKWWAKLKVITGKFWKLCSVWHNQVPLFLLFHIMTVNRLQMPLHVDFISKVAFTVIEAYFLEVMHPNIRQPSPQLLSVSEFQNFIAVFYIKRCIWKLNLMIFNGMQHKSKNNFDCMSLQKFVLLWCVHL